MGKTTEVVNTKLHPYNNNDGFLQKLVTSSNGLVGERYVTHRDVVLTHELSLDFNQNDFMKPDRLQMDIVVKKDRQFERITGSQKIVRHIDLGNHLVFLCYIEGASGFASSLNTDPFEVHKVKSKTAGYLSISTASAIVSYARIYMQRVKLDILKRGGVLYYTDTDSIVTNIPLPDDMVGDN